MNFKTSILSHLDESEFSNLATIAIPVEKEDPIKYEPINAIYFPVKGSEIREINFLLTDELNNIINYTNGNLNFTLAFRTHNCGGLL